MSIPVESHEQQATSLKRTASHDNVIHSKKIRTAIEYLETFENSSLCGKVLHDTKTPSYHSELIRFTFKFMLTYHLFHASNDDKFTPEQFLHGMCTYLNSLGTPAVIIDNIVVDRIRSRVSPDVSSVAQFYEWFKTKEQGVVREIEKKIENQKRPQLKKLLVTHLTIWYNAYNLIQTYKYLPWEFNLKSSIIKLACENQVVNNCLLKKLRM